MPSRSNLPLISACVGRRHAVPQMVHLQKMRGLTKYTSPTNCLSNLVFSWFHTRDGQNKTQHKHQFKNLHLTNVIWKEIRSLHPYCSFAFKRHSVTTIGSQRTNPLFTCAGYCRFDDCCVQVNLKIENESSHKAGGQCVTQQTTVEKEANKRRRKTAYCWPQNSQEVLICRVWISCMRLLYNLVSELRCQLLEYWRHYSGAKGKKKNKGGTTMRWSVCNWCPKIRKTLMTSWFRSSSCSLKVSCCGRRKWFSYSSKGQWRALSTKTPRVALLKRQKGRAHLFLSMNW